MEVKYRHEYKYLSDGLQNVVLKMRVKGLLQEDIYAKNTGYYDIRSLYFDTLDDKCYMENEDGVDKRDKYRIRIYNADSNKIILEKKSKVRQMTSKISCPISKEICRKLITHEGVPITEEMSDIQKKLLLEMQIKGMFPAVIVEYRRFPYVERNGNVRITFDENISSSNDIGSFFQKCITTRPVMEKGTSIMEVKWDSYLPSYISEQIQLETLQWTSFSKYYLCRKYSVYGGV